MEKLKNIKAIFLDIDGTLTNSNKQITENTKLQIKRLKSKGVYVILCSGRSNTDVCKYSKEALASDYAISSNGGQIYNYKTNKTFYKNNIDYLDLKDIWEYCNKNKLELVLNEGNSQYGNNIFCSNIYQNRVIISEIGELKNFDIYQIIINSNNYYEMKDCENYIVLNQNLKIANYSKEYIKRDMNARDPYYIFVNNKSVDKGIAIDNFLEAMNINKEETICFGDRINDITMFKICGNTVAMKNADSELKDIANYITLSNDEDGVAEFLKKYL